MVDLCQSTQPLYEDCRMQAKKIGLTPSERSVTRFLTATSRPLTLAFSLDSNTVISFSTISKYSGTDRPFGESFLLNRYPLLLDPHLRKGISLVLDTARS